MFLSAESRDVGLILSCLTGDLAILITVSLIFIPFLGFFISIIFCNYYTP